ncbi:MAG: phage portal protein [Hyphomonadaceae bacterium]
MARASIYRRVSRAIARALAPEMGVRRFDAAGWQRFPREARMNRTATETIAAAPRIRSKARYYVNNEPFAAAGVAALVTYAVGYGPTPAHERAEEFKQWAALCDADGRTDFGGIIANAVRAMAVDGESFVQFLQRPDGLRLRLIPAEQIDESKSAELSGGAFIAAGVEFDAQGNRVAYWVRPYLPTAQFETYAPPVRVEAADVLHLMRPVGVGQIRGVSWLAPIMLRLADLGLLSDALLKGFQVAAMHAGFLTDANGAAQLPFDGEKNSDGELEVSLEPGTVRRLPAGYDIKFSQPTAAQQSIEFRTSIVEEIAAGLGVPAFMVSANVSRANYSSLRAALITFKATLETLQFNVIVPQLLAPIWARWALVDSLRNGGEEPINGSALAEWRFPPAPEADAVKAAQAQTLLLKARIISRKEAIEERGESIERVDSDWEADTFAAEVANENDAPDDKEDSNAE